MGGDPIGLPGKRGIRRLRPVSEAKLTAGDRRVLTRGRKRATAPAAAGAIALVLALALGASVQAATYNVNKRGDHTPNNCTPADCTLREAILTANMTLGIADRVVLPSRKPYKLAIPGDDDGGQIGDLDIGNDRLTLVHPGKGRATVDADGVGRVFDVYSAATFKQLVITGGAEDYGGGIDVSPPGNATVTDSVVKDNHATIVGGGISTKAGAPLRVVHSRILGNRVDGYGGGVYAHDTLTMIGSLVAGNRTDLSGPGGLGGWGGGVNIINNTGPPSKIKNTSIIGNRTGTTPSSNGGGGLVADLGVVRVNGSTIANNRTGGTGGGIEVDGAEPFSIVNSTVANNRSGETGGGIHLECCEVKMNSVTVVRNRANTDGIGSEAGGGIYAMGWPFHVENSLIALNTLSPLMAGNPPVKNDCSSTDPLLSLGHNLLSTRSLCDGFDGPGDLVRGRPKIGRLEKNGGPTETIALKRGSAAIGKAHKPSAPGRDQRGRKRDNHPDIGAFER